MGYDFEFLEKAGIDTGLGMEYTGGQEKYISALSRYYRNYEKNLKNVEDSLGSNNLEDYMTYVHALKSNSKMVGNVKLAKAFETLELAAREKHMDTINNNHEKTLDMYKEFVLLIKPIGKANMAPPADEITGEEARKISKQLLEALDDFDDEKSSQLIGKLSGYPFRITQKEKLKTAASLVSDFDYDSAAEIIREIKETIE
ncbi:hypothetical protein [Butyrivibrio sp. INlla16]|uniref:hypothetical protein n=1 Tax=Butyrivibrio sp. INlla16 TaxID=1520807 RepID=UPI000880F946|nr:hypothetical protein [Butyrivibrio sp. INlla16]SDB43893.1 hypothetical protein SAMN02910263_02133 [Butyrivibrio sp. INlla16]